MVVLERPAAAPLSHRQYPGNSYRMRRHTDLSEAIPPRASRAVDAETARIVEASSVPDESSHRPRIRWRVCNIQCPLTSGPDGTPG